MESLNAGPMYVLTQTASALPAIASGMTLSTEIGPIARKMSRAVLLRSVYTNTSGTPPAARVRLVTIRITPMLLAGFLALKLVCQPTHLHHLQTDLADDIGLQGCHEICCCKAILVWHNSTECLAVMHTALEMDLRHFSPENEPPPIRGVSILDVVNGPKIPPNTLNECAPPIACSD
jgi:hypothetical protein